MQTDPEMPLLEGFLEHSGTLYWSISEGLCLKKCPLKWLNWSNMELWWKRATCHLWWNGSASVHLKGNIATSPPRHVAVAPASSLFLALLHFFGWSGHWGHTGISGTAGALAVRRGLLQTLHHKSKHVYPHKPTNRQVLVRECWSTDLTELVLVCFTFQWHTGNDVEGRRGAIRLQASSS